MFRLNDDRTYKRWQFCDPEFCDRLRVNETDGKSTETITETVDVVKDTIILSDSSKHLIFNDGSFSRGQSFKETCPPRFEYVRIAVNNIMGGRSKLEVDPRLELKNPYGSETVEDWWYTYHVEYGIIKEVEFLGSSMSSHPLVYLGEESMNLHDYDIVIPFMKRNNLLPIYVIYGTPYSETLTKQDNGYYGGPLMSVRNLTDHDKH